jgi:hypothetical protein
MSSNFNLVDTKSPNRRTDDIGKIELQNVFTLGMIYMMHGESLNQIKNDILFKGGIQNHVLILFYVQMFMQIPGPLSMSSNFNLVDTKS